MMIDLVFKSGRVICLASQIKC